MSRVGIGSKPCHLPLSHNCHLPSGLFFAASCQETSQLLGKVREEIGTLGLEGVKAPPVLSRPGADGNNSTRAPGDLAVAQAQLHIGSAALGESRDTWRLLFPPT